MTLSDSLHISAAIARAEASNDNRPVDARPRSLTWAAAASAVDCAASLVQQGKWTADQALGELATIFREQSKGYGL